METIYTGKRPAGLTPPRMIGRERITQRRQKPEPRFELAGCSLWSRGNLFADGIGAHNERSGYELNKAYGLDWATDRTTEPEVRRGRKKAGAA